MGLAVPKRRVTRTVTQPGLPEVLTPVETARFLRISIDTLRALTVPFVAIGSGRKRPRRRYLRATVLEWMRRREAPPE